MQELPRKDLSLVFLIKPCEAEVQKPRAAIYDGERLQLTDASILLDFLQHQGHHNLLRERHFEANNPPLPKVIFNGKEVLWNKQKLPRTFTGWFRTFGMRNDFT